MKKVKLGEVCEIRIGKTPNRSQTLYWGGDYPWLSISDMKGKILCTTKEKITQEAVEKEKMQIVSKGTVVMSFKLSIGKVGILAENMYTNEAIANFVVKNNKMLFNEYLYYALQGMNFDSLTDRAVMGKTLNKAKLNNLSIVYNEPFMQQQIVLRLDGVNKLIESRKQQLSELSKLVKSRFNEMFGSKKFDKVSISELVDDRIETAKKKFDQHDTIKYIDISSIDNKNYKMTGFQEYMLNQAPSRAQQHIRKGDIVVSTVRPNLKNIAITELDDENLVASSGFCVLRALKCLPEYLFAIICSDRFTNKMTNIVTGANYPAIKSSDIMNYIVPLPPIQLQNEFADFVAQVDKSQLAIQKSLEELETLKKSLMQEYFG